MHYFYWDTETTGLTANDKPYLLGYAWGDEAPEYIDLREEEGQNIAIELFSALQREDVTLCGANTYFDLRMLVQAGLITETQVNNYRVDDVIRLGFAETGEWFSLKNLARKHNIQPTEQGDLYALLRKNHKPNASDRWCILNAQLEWDACIRYCKADVAMTRELHALYLKAGTLDTYTRQMQGEKLACLISLRGAHVDSTLVDSSIKAVMTEKRNLEQEARDKYGVDLGSPCQIARALKIRNAQKETLTNIREKEPLADMRLLYTEAETARKNLLDCAGVEVIKPVFSWGLATGRASTKSPNLQGFPGRRVLGMNLRGVVIPAPGCTFYKADYSQMELRLIAEILDEPDMLGCFARGEDIHALHQNALVKGVPHNRIIKMLQESAETKGLEYPESSYNPDIGFAENEMLIGSTYWRDQTKRAVFGASYGAGVPRLLEMGVSRDAANTIVHLYRLRKQRSQKFNKILSTWRKTGIIQTLGGQRLRVKAEHMILNYIAQGSGAEIMRDKSVELQHNLEQLGGRVVALIHDEVLVEIPKNVVSTPDTEAMFRALIEETLKKELSKTTLTAEAEHLGENWRK